MAYNDRPHAIPHSPIAGKKKEQFFTTKKNIYINKYAGKVHI